MKQTGSFVGMHVTRRPFSVSVAEDGRSGPVRFIGVIPYTGSCAQDGEAAHEAW